MQLLQNLFNLIPLFTCSYLLIPPFIAHFLFIYLTSFHDGIIPPSGLPEPFTGSRHFSTAIYFLLEQGQYSRLHRIRSDEIWHFYLGGPLRLAMIHPDGKTDEIILGHDIAAGQTLQYVVPAGVWFGATPCAETDFSFVGCTVAPGFDFADFEMGKRESLKSAYPKAWACINEFGM